MRAACRHLNSAHTNASCLEKTEQVGGEKEGWGERKRAISWPRLPRDGSSEFLGRTFGHARAYYNTIMYVRSLPRRVGWWVSATVGPRESGGYIRRFRACNANFAYEFSIDAIFQSVALNRLILHARPLVNS